ncbi:deaminase, partial [Porticoccaceae bacterium]|nr:deaminase [Porticoccaceae bacterium]
KTKPEVIHAEMNCLAKLANSNESGKGAELYITHSPCIECAKMIYASGIVSVYYRKEYRDLSGVNFLRECGVGVEQI